MIIAITGQARSGGAALAEALHHMGYPVAIQTPTPMAPTWRFDWEDTRLSMEIMRGAPDQQWFAEYLLSRFAHAETLHKTETVVLKSPFLALYREPLDYAAEALGDKIFWVVMEREQDQIELSMDQWPDLSRVDNEQIQEIIDEAEFVAAAYVRYEDLVSDPADLLKSFCATLGLTPSADSFERAVLQIVLPTLKESF